MKKYPVVLDLETKFSFRDYADHRKLGVSVVGVFDYKSGEEKVFLENELAPLFRLLEDASYVVGFNIKGFDMPVLQAYYPGSVSSFPVVDILDDVKESLGRRLSLNGLSYATLGKRKSGNGLAALAYYREGKIEELCRYCLDDVRLTRELFEYGIKHGEILYLNEVKKEAIPVSWKKFLEDPGNNETPLTLPF